MLVLVTVGMGMCVLVRMAVRFAAVSVFVLVLVSMLVGMFVTVFAFSHRVLRISKLFIIITREKRKEDRGYLPFVPCR